MLSSKSKTQLNLYVIQQEQTQLNMLLSSKSKNI